jgi:hypothetical protein
MRVTQDMVTEARRAEFVYYQKGRAIKAERFIPTPDVIIRINAPRQRSHKSNALNSNLQPEVAGGRACPWGSRSGAAAVVFRRLGGMVKGNGHSQRGAFANQQGVYKRSFGEVATFRQRLFFWPWDGSCGGSGL